MYQQNIIFSSPFKHQERFLEIYLQMTCGWVLEIRHNFPSNTGVTNSEDQKCVENRKKDDGKESKGERSKPIVDGNISLIASEFAVIQFVKLENSEETIRFIFPSTHSNQTYSFILISRSFAYYHPFKRRRRSRHEAENKDKDCHLYGPFLCA